MSTSPIQIFTGSSTFAADFQSVITRAVAIASLPLKQYQNQKSDMTAQSTALTGLDATFAALQTAIQNLDTATGPASYASTSSDPTSVGATIGSGALAGTYTVDVVSLGSATSTLSGATLPAVADPYSTSISASTSFSLTVNGTRFPFCRRTAAWSVWPRRSTVPPPTSRPRSSTSGVRARPTTG